MSDAVPVRCPSCRREHEYTAPVYPCACGEPLAPPLLPAAPPERVTRRTWAEDWVLVRCGGCGRRDHWPQPELGCPCGVVLRMPVRPAGPSPRPLFRPVTIRNERDAVTVAARYLRWLGYRDVVRQEFRPPGGAGVRAAGLIARVDPSARPVLPREVECLWLSGMAASASTAYFALAGYAEETRARAEGLGVPLFVLEVTGRAEPVNAAAMRLVLTGA
ncbi:hypothetical protein [Streptomyces sp. NPDC001985]|uniref:hypothetical protein n=1 Tax=Streptomyces sp. NPDC001985 TaxID=3154406 RepID=UPI003322D5C1